jgi:hypothetical protein
LVTVIAPFSPGETESPVPETHDTETTFAGNSDCVSTLTRNDDNETHTTQEPAMTSFAIRLSAAAFAAAAVLAASAAPVSSAPITAGKASFDGMWSVLIVTERGTCDRAYRYPVRISNGSVGYAGEASFDVSGQVQPNGVVNVRVSRGSQSASGAGRMSLTDGSGYWMTAGGECSGTWSAERRG